MTISSAPKYDHGIEDAHAAIDLAMNLTECHANRVFVSTGEIKVGLRASVELHRHISSSFERLALYVEERVANNQTSPVSGWPK